MHLPSLFNRHGITRLANITGLDVLGVPVWSAVRPAARSYAVSAGKGLDPGHARVTAVMEAIETSCAEESERLCIESGSIAQMAGRARLVPLDQIGKLRRPPDRDRLRYWVQGHGIWGERWLAPYETIGVDRRSEAGWDTKAFAMTSAGTAAHPDPDLALSAALLEAIENDARALAMASPASMSRLPRVPLRPGTPVGDLAQAIEVKGVSPVMLDATTDIGFPVAFCLLAETPDAAGTVPVRTHGGSACRRTWKDAALAALLEAIQARLTTFAGARDDIHISDFARRPAAPEPPRRVSTPPPDGPDITLDDIAATLMGKGMGSPIIFDLAPKADPACVSVLIPGLCVCGGRASRRMRTRMIADALLPP